MGWNYRLTRWEDGSWGGHTGTDGERGQKPNSQWEEPDRVGSDGVTQVTQSTLKNKNMENQYVSVLLRTPTQN